MFGRNPLVTSNEKSLVVVKELNGISYFQKRGKDAVAPQEITGT